MHVSLLCESAIRNAIGGEDAKFALELRAGHRIANASSPDVPALFINGRSDGRPGRTLHNRASRTDIEPPEGRRGRVGGKGSPPCRRSRLGPERNRGWSWNLARDALPHHSLYPINEYTRVYMCIYIYIYVCMYVCMYIFRCCRFAGRLVRKDEAHRKRDRRAVFINLDDVNTRAL